MSKILDRTREILLEVFGSYISDDLNSAKEIINKNTFAGKNEPDEAVVLIHCNGIPSGFDSSKLLESWFEVSELLQTHYCEHINSVIIGVYLNEKNGPNKNN
ncbi:MAG: hypothetical protein Q8O87_02430 [bacterium]|nr:hypothetical protein [bacterium]